MDKNKISADLGLALETEEYIREKSLDLNVGYIEEYNEWELLIKYSGDISVLAEQYNFMYTKLLANYAVIRIGNEKIEEIVKDNSIIYIEKPNYIYQEQLQNRLEYNISCFDTEGVTDGQLNGEGIYVAVIDSGIDIFHDAFNDETGTRIKYIWDQITEGNPPPDYSFGTELDSDDINRIIKENIDYTGDITGHGTGVAGIITELVPAAQLLIVRLRTSDSGYSNSLNLIMAIDYVVKKALENNFPLVINLSYGNNYGDHNSNSAIERFIDDVSGYGKITIATGMGNEGTAGRHSQLMLGNISWAREEFLVNEFMNSFNLQIWKNYGDMIDIVIEAPNGEQFGPIKDYIQKYSTNQELISSVNNPPTPFNQKQEIFIVWAPQNNYIQEGIWKVIFLPKVIIDGRVDLWLPTSDATSSNVKFITPSEYTTLTIPASASKTISVGAYNPVTLAYASFSGRGFTTDGKVKPDIAAPGVNIRTPYLYNSYIVQSGTSFATPFVSAAAAMLMQWGITMGNDPFLYGEKVKTYLISGATKLPGYTEWPNERLGWGALCVSRSIRY